MVTRVQIGPEVVTSDDPITSPLDIEHSLGGNLLLLPLGDRVRGNPEALRKLHLGAEMPEDPVKCSVTHMDSFLHYRLNKLNHGFIAAYKPAADNKRMVDTPRPEHYPTFAAWLDATRKAFKLRKGDIAEIGGVTPQAVSKWFRNGAVGPEPLEKIANWAGVSYADLRLLIEGKPLHEPKGKKGLPPPSPAVQRIARKVHLLGDESSLGAVEVLVDTFLSQQTKKRRPNA